MPDVKSWVQCLGYLCVECVEITVASYPSRISFIECDETGRPPDGTFVGVVLAFDILCEQLSVEASEDGSHVFCHDEEVEPPDAPLE